MTVYKPMSNLGVLYTAKKDYAKAEPILREVLVARRRHFGDDHLETAEAKYNLFNVLWNSDRREEAWPLLEEAVPVIRKVLGDDNPAGSVVLFKYAFEMILTEDELKAQPLMLGCLRAERKKPGTTSGILSGAELNVEMLLLADQPVPARELAEELILTAEMIDPNGWRQFAAKSMIGESYTQEKKYPQAEPMLKAGYEGLRQQIDLKVEPQVRQLKDALKRLVEFYKVTNKPDEATKWQKELDRLPKE